MQSILALITTVYGSPSDRRTMPIGKVDDHVGNFLTFLQFLLACRCTAARESLLFLAVGGVKPRKGTLYVLAASTPKCFCAWASNTGGIILTEEDDNGLNYHPGAECRKDEKSNVHRVRTYRPTLLDSSFWFMLLSNALSE